MSSKEVLKDKNGNRVGEIEISDSKHVIKDKNGNRLGEYDVKYNVTKDKNGNKVGTGNLLTTLLRPY